MMWIISFPSCILVQLVCIDIWPLCLLWRSLTGLWFHSFVDEMWNKSLWCNVGGLYGADKHVPHCLWVPSFSFQEYERLPSGYAFLCPNSWMICFHMTSLLILWLPGRAQPCIWIVSTGLHHPSSWRRQGNLDPQWPCWQWFSRKCGKSTNGILPRLQHPHKVWRGQLVNKAVLSPGVLLYWGSAAQLLCPFLAWPYAMRCILKVGVFHMASLWK